MFEKASRMKLKFESTKGQLSVEDLWDLPLTSNTGKANLDDIARTLYKQMKEGNDISFVDDTKSAADTIAQLKFDIVKHIIDVRKAENVATLRAKENADKKRRIQEILAERQDDTLRSASIEELQRMVEAL